MYQSGCQPVDSCLSELALQKSITLCRSSSWQFDYNIFRVKQIQGELGTQIQADFEEAFQGAGAKVHKLLKNIF